MTRVIIIGGGFGGLSAAETLCRRQKNFSLEVTLLDKKETSDFLPALPDCIGRLISPQNLFLDLREFCSRRGIRFIREEVKSLDLEKKQVVCQNQALNYDYLVIASGSETNFYGNDFIRQNAFSLDDTADAQKIIRALAAGRHENFIVAGGGYTGVEVATNLRRFLKKQKRPGRVIIVERALSILGPLPNWMKSYVRTNLKRMHIEILTNSSVEKIEGKQVFLSGQKVFTDAMVVWAAGVKTAGFIQNLLAAKNPQGRLLVDNYLRLNSSCFVIGDAAGFNAGKNLLRMAVQFSIAQGSCVARSILLSIQNKKLCRYLPVDLGYIIPMANNLSCGKVFSFSLMGVLPTFLHYCMCIYRSYGWKNKIGIIKGLLKRGRENTA